MPCPGPYRKSVADQRSNQGPLTSRLTWVFKIPANPLQSDEHKIPPNLKTPRMFLYIYIARGTFFTHSWRKNTRASFYATSELSILKWTVVLESQHDWCNPSEVVFASFVHRQAHFFCWQLSVTDSFSVSNMPRRAWQTESPCYQQQGGRWCNVCINRSAPEGDSDERKYLLTNILGRIFYCWVGSNPVPSRIAKFLNF